MGNQCPVSRRIRLSQPSFAKCDESRLRHQNGLKASFSKSCLYIWRVTRSFIRADNSDDAVTNRMNHAALIRVALDHLENAKETDV
jgi:hypothetical protein